MSQDKLNFEFCYQSGSVPMNQYVEHTATFVGPKQRIWLERGCLRDQSQEPLTLASAATAGIERPSRISARNPRKHAMLLSKYVLPSLWLPPIYLTFVLGTMLELTNRHVNAPERSCFVSGLTSPSGRSAVRACQSRSCNFQLPKGVAIRMLNIKMSQSEPFAEGCEVNLF